jgi:signal transduction histidine kinase
VTSVVLPVAIGVAVLQRRLYDIPLVVDRSLTYGALSLAIAAIYALVVGGVGVMLRQPGAAWLAWLGAAVVAVTFAPLRDAVQRGANRLVYGQWSRPAEVVARTSSRLRDASDIPGLLQSLVDELGSGLALDYVAVSDTAGTVLAQHGSPGDDTDELPVIAYGAQVGTLTWTHRRLREGDRALLRELATQLGTVVHAMTMLETVRASQERLVFAGEEERKRLRRDLHDGLGPTLAALTLRVDTLRNGLRGSESRASIGADGLDAALLDLRRGIQTTVADVRRIVEGLRPSALDELGLADAVEELAARMAAGSGLAIEVHAGQLAPMSAAAEVAAYRIVQEALNNAVQHARATRVVVTLATHGSELVIAVADDGTGAVAPRANGVGLLSMRERASALGGELHIDAVRGRGTTITARLPIPVSTADVAVAG